MFNSDHSTSKLKLESDKTLSKMWTYKCSAIHFFSE